MSGVDGGELERRVTRLLTRLEVMPAIAGLRFNVKDRAVLDECYRRVGISKKWTFVDLRNANADKARASMSEHRATSPLVLAVHKDRVPPAVLRYAHAMVDKSETIDLGDHLPFTRDENQRLAIICEGCAELTELPHDLERISYWEPGIDD